MRFLLLNYYSTNGLCTETKQLEIDVSGGGIWRGLALREIFLIACKSEEAKPPAE